jgi:hypothetical protein
MRTALFSNLQSIVGCFSKSTPDDEVTSELISLCNAHGDNVTVAKQTPNSPSGERHFLIGFESITDAIQFAVRTDRVTHENDGVMIKVA